MCFTDSHKSHRISAFLLFFFFFLLFSPRRSSVAAFKVCLHLRGYTNTVVAIPNSDDYEQLGVEGSHVRLVLPKHHLPDPVI